MLKTTLICSSILLFASCVKNDKDNSSKLATINIPSFDFEYDKLDLKVSKDDIIENVAEKIRVEHHTRYDFWYGKNHTILRYGMLYGMTPIFQRSTVRAGW